MYIICNHFLTLNCEPLLTIILHIVSIVCRAKSYGSCLQISCCGVSSNCGYHSLVNAASGCTFVSYACMQHGCSIIVMYEYDD